MSIHRQAAKRDANEAAIVKALEQLGCTVQRLSATGCPDLLVGYHGVNWLFEVKVAKGTLTDDELFWHELWNGQVAVIRSVDDALRVMGIAE